MMIETTPGLSVTPKLMEKLLKKFLAVISLTLVSAVFCSAAFASTYRTSFSFSETFTTSSRTFTGSNITFSTAEATSFPYRSALDYTYTVSLYKDNMLMPDTKIGTATLTRDAAGTATWKGVGSGKYYIYLSKANDGVFLNSSDVTISN